MTKRKKKESVDDILRNTYIKTFFEDGNFDLVVPYSRSSFGPEEQAAAADLNQRVAKGATTTEYPLFGEGRKTRKLVLIGKSSVHHNRDVGKPGDEIHVDFAYVAKYGRRIHVRL